MSENNNKIGTAFTVTSEITDDAYFLQLTDYPKHFIHFDDETGEDYIFKVKEGIIGAIVLKEEKAKMFVEQGGYGNVQLVNVKETLEKNKN